MNFTLLGKEIRDLALCFWLSAGLSLVFLVYILATGFPDMPEEEWPVLELSGVLIFAVLIGSRALTRDRDEGTQGFLDGLPITRSAVFAHKGLAALIVMIAISSLDLILGLSFRSLAKTSLDAPTDWSAIPLQFILPMLMAVMIIALSMLASFAKGYFPLVSGIILVLFVLLYARGGELSGWIDSPILFDVGENLPFKSIVGHSVIGGLALLCSWALFRWRETGLSLRVSKVANIWWVQWFKWPVLLGGIAVWFGVMVYWVSVEEADEDQGLTPAEAAAGDVSEMDSESGVDTFSEHSTEFYQVIFRTSQRKRIMPLFGRMDGIHRDVTGFFQNPPPTKSPIVLDMASVVSRHAAGQANWTKIRVPSRSAMGKGEFDRILRHETAHVYIEQLSKGAASDYFNAFRTFHEGLATVVENSVSSDATRKERLRMERTAVLSDGFEKVPLELLLDDAALGKERLSSFLVYSLGLVFAEAVMDVGGDEMPRKILETLRDDPPPPGASTSEIWRYLFQKCGTSFDHVIAAYRVRLAELRERESEFLEKIPSMSAVISYKDQTIIITPDLDGSIPDGFQVVLAVAQDYGLVDEPRFFSPDEWGAFRVPKPANGKPLQYALGWRSKGLGSPCDKALGRGKWCELGSQPTPLARRILSQ